jgi:hypothetical protein
MPEDAEPKGRKRRATTPVDPRLSPEVLRALAEREKAEKRAAEPDAEPEPET